MQAFHVHVARRSFDANQGAFDAQLLWNEGDGFAEEDEFDGWLQVAVKNVEEFTVHAVCIFANDKAVFVWEFGVDNVHNGGEEVVPNLFGVAPNHFHVHFTVNVASLQDDVGVEAQFFFHF